MRYGWMVIALILVMPGTVLSFSSGPGDGYTGAPGEQTCVACHSDYPLNSGDGAVSLHGVSVYPPFGETYLIKVRVEDPGQTRWGFELTCVDSNGDAAGYFTVDDPVNLQVSDNPDPDRDYVKQTAVGTAAGTADIMEWYLYWTAPAMPDPPEPIDVTFYLTGNAANNGSSTAGDYIYSTSLSRTVYLPPIGIPSMNLYGIIAALLIFSAALLGLRYRG